VGVTTRGAALSLDELDITDAEGHPTQLLSPAPMPSPRDRALAAFCLLLLNLNEVVYVD
jgi:hypothetical protein